MRVFAGLRSFRNHFGSLRQYVAVEGKNGSTVSSFVSFFIFWTIGEHIRTNQNNPPLLVDSSSPWSASRSPSVHFAFVEAIKISTTCIIYMRCKESGFRGRHRSYASIHQDEEARGYSSLHPSHGFLRPAIMTVAAAFFYAVQKYLTIVVAECVVDPTTLYTIFACVTLCSLFVLFSFLGRSFSSLQWQGALFQLCGMFVAQTAIAAVTSTPESVHASLCLVLSRSLALVLIDNLYNMHQMSSKHILHLQLFASGLLIHISVSIVHHIFLSSTVAFLSSPSSHGSFFTDTLVIFCQAGVDLASLSIIHNYDAVVEGLARSLIAACFLTASLNLNVIFGCLIVFAGSLTYQGHTGGDNLESARNAIGIVTFASLSIYAAYSALGDMLSLRLRGKPSSVVINPPPVVCERIAHPLSRISPEDRVYHSFDNILLIVFFSHARYDANLDFYRLTYEEFFPNMVFIGPASREDKGFAHSYDVIVDSYQADEDLNSDPSFYKMAGRMAHHMLYTALKEYPCYDGYLWAPFDTLLNLPRLQQFDQQKAWYHSPFGQYLYNPTLGNNSESPDWHPPTAKISPDPALNLTENWRGWGPDWWWGDPHVGLQQCMPAFEKVPSHMRVQLAFLTNGTRFIGGSADTLYIPGKYIPDFMKVLELFLETNCFLEIATPTALHLVVPPLDTIQFIDHWWIWNPPLNATFVRRKWEEGFEVDTFHTFHWGDKREDGVWIANRDNIADVRNLLVESAQRQNVDFPHQNWELDDRKEDSGAVPSTVL